MIYQPLTQEQFQKARGAGFSAEQIIQMDQRRKTESIAEVPQKSVTRKVAEFIAPTATRTFGKIRAGEGLTGRDIAGSALEIGSFFIPASGIARGLGLVGKGALTLGRKAALGAATGAAAGGTFEAGRTIGQEGTGVRDVAEATAFGLGAGGAFGAALPVGIAGARAIPRVVKAIPTAFKTAREAVVPIARSTQRGVLTGAKAVAGLTKEAVKIVGKRIPEKVGQFVERRAEQKAYLKGKPFHVQEAVKKNIERPIIDFVRNATPQDKLNRVKMLDIAKRGTEDLSFRGQAKQVPGESIVKGPIAHLIQIKDIAISQTRKALDKLGGRPQNARPLLDKFVNDMAEAGVVVDEGKLISVRGSKIPEGDLKFYQQVYNELIPTKRGDVPLTYQQMHQLRQKWFDIARADKTFTSGPTAYARHLRSLLAQPIDQASKGRYLAAQNKTRESLEGLQDYVRLTGYKGKLEDIGTKDLKAGEVFMRIFGNAADRPSSVLNKIYDTAKKYGYKGSENIHDQLRFADILEDVYGSTTRSLRGQIGRGISDVSDPLSKAASAAREAVKWSPVSAALRLTRGFLAGTGDDTLRSFENLVRAEAGQGIPSRLGSKGYKTVGGLFKDIKKAASPLIQEGRSKIQTRPEVFGTLGGIEQDETTGQVKFNPEKAALGVAGIAAFTRGKKTAFGKKTFKGLKNLSTKLLEKFRGESTEITPQRFNEIINRSQKEGIKKADLDIVRESAKEVNGKINLANLSKNVEKQLVPLTPTPVKSPRWSHIGEDFIGDGKYGEIVYQSPIKTSAGDVHFSIPGNKSAGDVGFPNYFSHVRYEDMADGKTRKILETQSDLMQKDNFAREFLSKGTSNKNLEKIKQAFRSNKSVSQVADELNFTKREDTEQLGRWISASESNLKTILDLKSEKEALALKNYLRQLRNNLPDESFQTKQRLSPLKPYSSNDPLAHLRTFREEVKRAAKDGKDTILIPSGETAMKIEGLGDNSGGIWTETPTLTRREVPTSIKIENLKVGKTISRDGSQADVWIITDVLGDGKFKAVPKDRYMEYQKLDNKWSLERLKESFDISGKVDTQHFVYKLNEEAIPREARKLGLNVTGKIEKDNGTWWRIEIPRERARLPVEAFGAFGGIMPTIPKINEERREK